jgi:hypothetical protein
VTFVSRRHPALDRIGRNGAGKHHHVESVLLQFRAVERTTPNTCPVCGESFDSEDELRSHEEGHSEIQMVDILLHIHIHLDICQRLLEQSRPIEAQEWLGKAQDEVRQLAPFIGLNLESE